MANVMLEIILQKMAVLIEETVESLSQIFLIAQCHNHSELKIPYVMQLMHFFLGKPLCNIESCSYDAMTVNYKTSCYIIHLHRLNDGLCDEEHNTLECKIGGGDCTK